MTPEKGDTKTDAALRVAAEGSRSDLPSDRCCNTKTQNLILDVAERIIDVEDEVEELKNNPDVVDIVDTYADLQSYDTSTLTDNDIIRVLADETHSGNSTYYRWNATDQEFDFIGEITGGGSDGIVELTSADYNYPTDNPTSVALWLLPDGLYRIENSSSAKASTSTNIPHGSIVAVYTVDTNIKGYSFFDPMGSYKITYGTTQISDGARYQAPATTLDNTNVLQTTGTSSSNVMSQNATTSLVYADPGTNTKIKIGDHASESEGNNGIEIGHYASASTSGSIAIGGGNSSSQGAGVSGTFGIAIGSGSKARSNRGIVIGDSAEINDESAFGIAIGAYSRIAGVDVASKGSIALGYGSRVLNTPGVIQIDVTNPSVTNPTQYGYDNTIYRLIRGVHDGQEIHDAATVAQGNTLSASAPTTATEGVLGQLYTDTTNMHTYQCTAISGSTYTWTQRW